MSKHQARFSQLPRAAVIDTSLSSTDFKVLAIIGLYLNHDREAWPSQDTIAEVGGMSRRTVIRAIKSLEDAGYIESRKKYPNRPGTHKCYRVVMSESDKNGTSENAAGVTSECDTALSLPIRTSPDELTTSNDVVAREQKKTVSRPRGASRATRIPDNWTPTAKDYAFATSKGLTPQEINNEADRFRDYWTAAGGAKARKRDWEATWRNWVTSDFGLLARKRNAASQSRRNGSLADQFTRFADAMEGGSYGREAGNQHDADGDSGFIIDAEPIASSW